MTLPYQAVPQVAQFQMIFTIDAQRVQNDLYFHKDGDWAASDLGAANDAILTYFNATGKNVINVSANLVEITATCLTSLDSPRIAGMLPEAIAGTHVGDYLPLNATIACKLATTNRGRGRNGRVFFPVLSEAQVTGDQVVEVTAGEIVAYYMAIQAAVVGSGDGITPVVVHRYRDKARLMPAEWSAIVEVLLSDTYIDSQRNRLPFHKKHKKKPATP